MRCSGSSDTRKEANKTLRVTSSSTSEFTEWTNVK